MKRLININHHVKIKCQKVHVRIEMKNNLNAHKSKMKKNEKIDSMIIYSRLIEGYLITSMLTSPPWGNGEVKKGEKWYRMGIKAKMGVNYVNRLGS